ncbi:MAG TPA: M20 family metallopeptidase [Bacillota bacterium]|nr:M20 family metallopeptidase [Bacillota bacterium]
MDSRDFATGLIEDKRPILSAAADKVWEFAETKFEEVQSAQVLIDLLEREGFQVQTGLADMSTAFVGSYGRGGPVVAILGEYDALSGLSQAAETPEPKAIVSGANGHGCGHNLLGVGALAAAIAVRHYMEAAGLPGTVRYYGCPGEENGSGKAFMARAGLFSDVDFALTWHPGTRTAVRSSSSLANYSVYYRFTGRSAHAAGAPHLGRSALDAVELMSVGVNFLREHIIPEARLHYAMTKTGGRSPNVVQALAEVAYLIRAPRTPQVEEIYQRVNDVARGAAMMTGTTVEIIFDKACSNIIPNQTLERVMYENLVELGAPSWTPEELQFARRIQETLTEPERGNDRIPPSEGPDDSPLHVGVRPFQDVPGAGGGSSDVGDVSWLTPTAQLRAATWAVGTPGHSWQVVTQGTTTYAHKGMLLAGKTIAATAVHVMQNPEIIAKAKAELAERLAGEKYVSPIPADVKPAPTR